MSPYPPELPPKVAQIDCSLAIASGAGSCASLPIYVYSAPDGSSCTASLRYDALYVHKTGSPVRKVTWVLIPMTPGKYVFDVDGITVAQPVLQKLWLNASGAGTPSYSLELKKNPPDIPIRKGLHFTVAVKDGDMKCGEEDPVIGNGKK